MRVGGTEYELDAIVFATGFDAMTGSLAKLDISGAAASRSTDKWAEGPQTYLGLMVAGFPNMFMITGPGSPSVLSQHDACRSSSTSTGSPTASRYLREHGIDAHRGDSTAAEDDVGRHTSTRWRTRTLYPQANSWYMGANIPGKPRVFMPYIGGVPAYRRDLRRGRGEGL